MRNFKIAELYKQGKTYQEIGEHFGITRQRVQQIIKALTIPKPVVKRDCICGKKFEVSRLNKSFCIECSKNIAHFTGRDRAREIVRMRDKHTCQSCGKKWEEGTRRFDVHHLNGLCGKKSTGFDGINDIDGLTTLCHKCHLSMPHIKMGPNGSTKKNKSKILRLSAQGRSIREICKKLQVTYPVAHRLIVSKRNAGHPA
jgi:DNA-binding CsgD family transcriptional regulator